MAESGSGPGRPRGPDRGAPGVHYLGTARESDRRGLLGTTGIWQTSCGGGRTRREPVAQAHPARGTGREGRRILSILFLRVPQRLPALAGEIPDAFTIPARRRTSSATPSLPSLSLPMIVRPYRTLSHPSRPYFATGNEAVSRGSEIRSESTACAAKRNPTRQCEANPQAPAKVLGRQV